MRRTDEFFPELRRFVVIFTPDHAVANAVLNDVARSLRSEQIPTRSSESLRLRAFREAFETLANSDRFETDALSEEAFIAKLNGAGPAPHAKNGYRRFAALPFAERAAMALIVVEKFSVDDAAAVMKTTPETVRKQLARARRKLDQGFWESFGILPKQS